MIHRMECWVVPSSSWMLSLFMVSPGACLRHCHLLCKLSRHHRCEVRSGTHFFIAVYSVGGFNDLM